MNTEIEKWNHYNRLSLAILDICGQRKLSNGDKHDLIVEKIVDNRKLFQDLFSETDHPDNKAFERMQQLVNKASKEDSAAKVYGQYFVLLMPIFILIVSMQNVYQALFVFIATFISIVFLLIRKENSIKTDIICAEKVFRYFYYLTENKIH